MAGNITLALRTATSGLLVNQQALDAVANNIANVNSPGYSRKVVNLEQRVVNGTPAGVQISEVTRMVDEGLMKSLRGEFGTHQTYDIQTSYFERLEDLFGAPGDNTSISHTMQEFASAMEALATTPSNVLEQQDLVRRATELTNRLQTMSTTIQELRAQADSDVADQVDTANELITRISTLNDEIVRNSAVNNDVTDLKDQLDSGLDDLSKILDITYFYKDDGDVVVFTADGRSIISDIPSSLIHNEASSVSSTTTHADGGIQGLYVGTVADANDITNALTKGSLKGLVDLRDKTLPGLQSQLDELAAQLRDQINQVHNRGVAHPGLQTMTGTRKFLDTATSTITYSGNEDTRVVLFDSSGNQQATTTIRTVIGGSEATIDDLATRLQVWLRDNGPSGATVSTSNGVFEIELNDTTQYLSFRDETASTAGSTHQDASIQFDVTNDGTIDETVSGFSNFFGLNDFFVDGLTDNIMESDVVPSTYTFSAFASYEFRDTTGALSTLTINQNDTLQDVIDQIEDNATLGATFNAALVPDGAGVRLRISHQSGLGFTIYQTGGSGSGLSDINMHQSDARVSTVMEVRSDIISQPSRVSRGAAQWDSTRGVNGEYLSSASDNAIAESLASLLNTTLSFEEAGNLGDINATFSQYAAGIVGASATAAASNEQNQEYYGSLVDSLKFKSDTFRGVNLDEEMAQLIVFEQAYSAAARVISTIQSMFDTLDSAVS